MNKKIKILIIILLIIFLLIFFVQRAYKTVKTGNNISKSTDDLIEYILNISSYEAKLEVTIHSNKTTNQYRLEQYWLKPNYSKQIVKEPKNIENLEIIYNGKNLEVLWLNFFIENYKDEYNVEENADEIILSCKVENGKRREKLYINKKTSLPTKIEILDNSNQSKVYIEYKEIKLNNIRENNIFAFKTIDISKEV